MEPPSGQWFLGVNPHHPLINYWNRYGERRPARIRLQDDDSCMVIYRVIPTSGGWKEEDASIYVFQQPGFDVSANSILGATVPTPFSRVLSDYKNMRQAQIRRSHADAWNTTARILSTFSPKLRVEDNPSQYLMDFVHEDHYAPPDMGTNFYPPFEAHNVWQVLKMVYFLGWFGLICF